MRISDWSSDVCSSDLKLRDLPLAPSITAGLAPWVRARSERCIRSLLLARESCCRVAERTQGKAGQGRCPLGKGQGVRTGAPVLQGEVLRRCAYAAPGQSGNSRGPLQAGCRSEERRVGKECVRTGRYRGWPILTKKKK